MRRLAIPFVALVTVIGAALAMIGRIFLRREKVDWRDAEIAGQVAEIDGVGIHYLDRGKGGAVILVHGFGGHTFSFRGIIPALSADYRVVAVDLIGFGYSERPENADYSLTAQAQRVLALMDYLKIDRAAAIGHSMGGEVVMRMAAVAPDRIARLVLAGSVSGDRLPSLPVTPLIKPFLPATVRLTGSLMLSRTVYDPDFITPEVREGYLAPKRVKGSMNALYQILRDGRKDRRIDYSKINQPTLVLWAAGERIVPKIALNRIREHLPQAEVVTIQDAGHLLLEEQPEACLTAIREFLAAPAPEALERETVTVDEAVVPA
jgi:pimeloyl-ACP methyl ester carboxylesterase